MVKLASFTPFRKFKFAFWFEGPDSSWRSIPVFRLATTPDGFMVWRAHVVDEPPLMVEIGEAKRVRVTLKDQVGPFAHTYTRTLLFNVSDPMALPLDCHAVEDDVALQGVLFRECELVSMEDVVEAELAKKE